MRPILLTAVIFLVVPSITRAQQTSALINQQLDQQANLEIKNKPLPQAMKEIANQTGVRIEAAANVYDLLPWGDQTSVTATIKNQTLREGIDAIARKLVRFEGIAAGKSTHRVETDAEHGTVVAMLQDPATLRILAATSLAR